MKYYWGRHNNRVRNNFYEFLKLKLIRLMSFPFQIELCLKLDILLKNDIKLRPTNDFDLLYNEIKPDFVFNCSHIHGVTADLPLRVAKHFKIPTEYFLFSWIIYHQGVGFFQIMINILFGQKALKII